MSTNVPVITPAIPHPMKGHSPEESINSLFDSVLSIKQNIEIGQGTRGTAFASGLHGPSALETKINAALRKV